MLKIENLEVTTDNKKILKNFNMVNRHYHE